MPNFLIGTSYAVSAGLIVYAIQSDLAPDNVKFPLILAWAVAGIVLAFSAVFMAKKES